MYQIKSICEIKTKEEGSTEKKTIKIYTKIEAVMGDRHEIIVKLSHMPIDHSSTSMPGGSMFQCTPLPLSNSAIGILQSDVYFCTDTLQIH